MSRHPTQTDAEPRIVVLVELAEGIRIVSNLIGTPVEAVTVGQAVEVVFVDHDTFTLPQFRVVAP